MWNVSLRFMRMDSSGPMFMPFWRFSWTSPLKGLLETGTNWKVYCIHFFEFEEWEHHGTPKITIFGLQMNPITFHRNRLLLNHLNLHIFFCSTSRLGELSELFSEHQAPSCSIRMVTGVRVWATALAPPGRMAKYGNRNRENEWKMMIHQFHHVSSILIDYNDI